MDTSTLVSPPALVQRDQKHDTAAVQALDSAHFIHPFTDHADLASMGAKVIVRADNIYVFDSEGPQMLDAMSGLWCVNAGYARKELADAAYQQMMTLPYYNNFFHTTNVPAVKLAAKLASLAPEVDGRSFQARVYSSSGMRATTPMCAWCAATGTCWVIRDARSSSAARTPTTAAPWPVPRWVA